MILKSNSNKVKLSLDLFYLQMKLALLPLISANIGIFFVSNKQNINFFDFTFSAARFVMIVIVIFTCFEFANYIRNAGITRRDYFYASAISTLGISFSIMILAAIFTGVLTFLDNYTGYTFVVNTASFIETNSEWLIPILGSSMMLFSYYLASGFIAIAFYRRRMRALSIIVALLYIIFIELIWMSELLWPLSGMVIWIDMSYHLAFVLNFILIVIGLGIIRLLTKSMAIKIE
ncbi:hypothetical protein [Natronospora cellulosivora (SeqCode)]